jgi:hypothetical protein
MLNACREHASAASNSTRPSVLEAMFMSILLSQQKELAEIKNQLERIGQRLEQQ